MISDWSFWGMDRLPEGRILAQDLLEVIAKKSGTVTEFLILRVALLSRR